MTYAVCDDILRRYEPIKSMIGTGTLDVSTVDVASIYIADAESIVNAYLSARYIVPLQPEAILTDLTSDIAIYRILRDRTPRIPDYMVSRYTDATSMLEMIRDGKMNLTASSQTVNSGAGDQFVWSNVLTNNGPIFKPVEAQSLCGVASPSYLEL